MNAAITHLETLQVQHAMSPDVVPVEQHQSLEQAAHVLVTSGISASPVVDEQGRCVGVLSAADLLRAADQMARQSESLDVEEHFLESSGDDEPLRVARHSDRVCYHMTRAVQTVERTTPLLRAALIMTAEHIHRLVVLDSDQRPIGIVSTMDILAALLHATDENRPARG